VAVSAVAMGTVLYPEREVTPSETLDRTNFLPKPYTPAELARRVGAVLEDARS
jgi:hypothetical protein